MEIYQCNNRFVPNIFRMHDILEAGLRCRFGEYVDLYKRCNGGYS
jgi:hypothetical protein